MQLFTIVEYIDLPIMKPTEYMYNTVKDYGNEKWEIFSEVCRDIYCDVGGFKKTCMTLRDNCRYSKIMEEMKWIDREEILDKEEKEENEKIKKVEMVKKEILEKEKNNNMGNDDNKSYNTTNTSTTSGNEEKEKFD